MTTLAAECFRTALRSLVDGRGRGAQTDLAEQLGMSRSAFNDILTGRKGTSTKTQERIAAHFGLSLGEMLRIGENMLQGRVVFPWAQQLEGLTKRQQLKAIIELTNEQVGHPQDNLFFVESICDFLEGSASPSDLYNTYLKMARSRAR